MSVLDYPGLTRYDSKIKDFLNGVAKQTVSKSQTDLNTLIDQGIYYVTGTVADHHFPIGTNGTLLVLRTNATAGQGFVQQFFRRTGTAGTNDHQTFLRECGSGGTGTWGEWKQLMTSNNVVKNTGSASQPVYIDSNGVTQACTTTFADDSGVVHIAGTEDITGKKTVASNLNVKNANLTRGTNPSSNSWIYMTFSGSGGDATNQRFGTVASGVYTTGTVRLYLEAYKNTVNTTTNAQLAVTYPASGDPYASAPTTPTGSTGTEIVTADYLNSTNSGVVHTTGNETIAGIKSFTGRINIADGSGITFTSNGVTQSLISSVLDSVEGNNAVNLRLGYGGSTYVTSGECAGYITADNGFSYGAEAVQIMADSGIHFRPSLGNGWNADYGAYMNSESFRPMKSEGLTLGSATYKWGDAYLGTVYTSGSVVWEDTATIDGTSKTHRCNISMNDSSLNFGAWDETNRHWVWLADPAGNNTFYGNASTATKATQDASGNNIANTYLPKSGGAMTGAITSTIETTVSASRTTGNVWTVRAERSDKSNAITFGIGSAGVNRGIYDSATSKWIIYCDGTNSASQLNVTDTSDDSATHLASTGWVKDVLTAEGYAANSAVVHLAGAETITGIKTHNAEINMQYSTVTKGTAPTSNKYMSYKFVDNAGNTMGGVQSLVDKTTGNNRVRIYAYRNTADATDFGALGIIQPTTGDPYGYAPSTPATATDNQIVTADWVVGKNYATQSWVTDQGYLTEHQPITGKINVSGSRGNLAGYQTPLDVTEATSITYSSRDIIRVNASNITITVANSSSSAAWVKWVFFTDGGRMNLGNKWAWQGKEGPVISKDSLIMLIWCKTRGWALHMPAGETWS